MGRQTFVAQVFQDLFEQGLQMQAEPAKFWRPEGSIASRLSLNNLNSEDNAEPQEADAGVECSICMNCPIQVSNIFRCCVAVAWLTMVWGLVLALALMLNCADGR